MNYTRHHLSAIFDSMSSEDFQGLKDSIEVNGVLNPITIYDGQIIDGWHRYQAASELAMPCPEQQLEDWIDPRDFVIAQNGKRKHQTAAQLSSYVIQVYAWKPLGANQHGSVVPTEATGSVVPTEATKSSKELAAIAGVSTASIEKAKTVQTKATPEVQKAVKDGKIGLEKAVAISKLPQDEQAAAISKPIPKRPEYSAEDRLHDELAGKQHAIEEMAAEIASLKDGFATAGDPTSAEIISGLRTELASVNAELNAIKSQRDILMSENHELKKQCGMYMKKLKLVA